MPDEDMKIEIPLAKLKESPPYSWTVRKCELYKEEYKDCRKFKERFHQYFIHGEFSDCSQWKKDYDTCMVYRKTSDLNALDELIKSELNRQKERLEGNLANDVWEKREQFPPPNWNCDLLPINVKNKQVAPSYLAEMKKSQLNEDNSKPKHNSSFCTIL